MRARAPGRPYGCGERFVIVYNNAVSSIGLRLRNLRIANRFSITDVSDRTGISRAQISLIENGKADPRLSTVLRLLDAYGGDLSDLRVPRSTPMSIEEFRNRASEATTFLKDMGLGPSDPEARLDLKESKGVDVSAERRALATRK